MRYLLLSGFLICPILLSAQWAGTNTPRFRHVNKLLINQSGQLISFGGNESNDAISTISISEDSGQNWMLTEDTPLSAWYNHAALFGPTTICAVGDKGKIAESFNLGDTWNKIELPGGLKENNIYAVSYTTSGSLIVAGGLHADTARQIIAIRNTKGEWQTILFRKGPVLRNLLLLSNNRIIACGDSGQIVLSGDSFADLHHAEMPLLPKGIRVSSLFFLNDSIGFAVGGRQGPDSVQIILRSGNGGERWEEIVNRKGPALNALGFVNSADGWIAGDYGTVLRTEDSGVSWNKAVIPSHLNDERHLKTLCFGNRYFAAFGGEFGKFLVYIDSTGVPPQVRLPEIRMEPGGQVQYKALVNANELETQISFLYAVKGQNEMEIIPYPSLINGSDWHDTRVITDKLEEGNTYSVRIKAINQAGESYSKPRYFFYGKVIPNWSFEEWDTLRYDFPKKWETTGKIEKIALASGDTGVSMRSVFNEPGVIMLGYYENGSLWGGVPMEGRPDSLVVQSRHDIVPGDKARIYLILKKNGIVISNDTFMLEGSSGGLFIRNSFAITYFNNSEADSMILAIVTGNHEQGMINAGNILVVDEVLFSGEGFPVPNGSFNDWNSYIHFIPEWWNTETIRRPVQNEFPTQPAPSLFHGAFALEMKNIKNGEEFITARITSSSPLLPSAPSFAAGMRHENLYLYLKFEPVSSDSIFLIVHMYKEGLEIGNGNLSLSEKILERRLVSIPLNYIDNEIIPDSGAIEIAFNKSSTNIGTHAVIDALSFDAIALTIPERTNEGSVVVFPNPFDGKITVSLNKPGVYEYIRIIDYSGRVLYECKIPESSSELCIDGLEKLNKGIYLLQMGSFAKKSIMNIIRIMKP